MVDSHAMCAWQPTEPRLGGNRGNGEIIWTSEPP